MTIHRNDINIFKMIQIFFKFCFYFKENNLNVVFGQELDIEYNNYKTVFN